MSAREALSAALGDFYQQSWRLFVLNAALSAACVPILVAALWAPAVLALLVLVGPLAAAVMYCAVRLAQTEELRLRDALTGLRLLWRRGIELGLFSVLVVAAGIFAVASYTRGHALALPLAFLVGYLLALFGVLQLQLWPLAVVERDRRFRDVVREALGAFARRPGPSLGLALALLLVNVVGAAAALLPLLTLTVAYSFLAAAHFALPPHALPEEGT
jgi:hypothetical protein